MTVAVAIAGLVKTFGRTRAVDGLELSVDYGQVHGFQGPNGAGKTTTIRILLGLLRADSGTVTLLGGDPWRDAVTLHGRLAYVPSEVNLRPLFPTQAALDQAAAASANNAAAIAFNGPVQGLDTVGDEVAFQSGTVGLILVALMSLLLTARYTRAEEESGRIELLRATVLGRHAQAALLLAWEVMPTVKMGSAR